MLHFGMKAPLSFEKFLQACKDLIPDDELGLLLTVSLGDYSASEQPTLRRWRAFDIELRNELAKIRASRKHIDAHKYLREDGCAEPSIAHAAMAAHRMPSIIEAERLLDQYRWQALDDMAFGHYFDIDALIVYAYKLRVLERWDAIRATDKRKALEEVTRH